MGLTAEEIRERQASQKLNELKYTVPNDGKEFVFVSYKSDDWKEVLEDVVFELQKRTGLRIYYDRAFDFESDDIWLKQMKEAIKTPHCRGILMFISESYMTSYATLMEVLYSQTKPVRLRHKKDELKLFEIYLSTSNPEAIIDNISKDRKTCTQKIYMKEDEWKDYKKIVEEISKSEEHKFYEGASWLNDIEEGELTKEDIGIAFSLILNGNMTIKSNDDYFYNSLESKIMGGCKKGVFDESLKENEKRLDSLENEIEKPTTEVSLYSDKLLNVNISKGKFIAKKQTIIQKGKDSSDKNIINYKIYDMKYSNNQSDFMLQVFEQVLKRHLDKIDEVANTFTCASKTDFTLKGNKTSGWKSYFRTCKNFNFGDENTICIGTSYGMVAKLSLIARLLSICNEDANVLDIEGYQLPKVKIVKDSQLPNEFLISKEKIGVYAKNTFLDLFSNNKISKQEINEMLTQEYATKNLNLGYPLLVKSRDENNKTRYWKDSVLIHGHNYYICSQWYEHQRDGLEKWKINKMSSLG